MTARKLCRNGLTLIELIVVLGVISLLLGLLLAAVNAARESARRVQCVANLSQFGRALQNYQSQNGVFPPAMPAVANQSYSDLWYAPHVGLLPFLEQSPVAANINPQQPMSPNLRAPGEATGPPWPGSMAAWRHLAVFRCPSDQNGAGRWAGNSYRVSTGSAPKIGAPSNDELGAFVALRGRHPADFIDGLSTTVGAAEKLIGSAAAFSRKADFWYSGAWLVDMRSANQVAHVCGALSGAPPKYYPYSGASWFFAGYENSWYNHVVGPNASIPDCSWDYMDAGEIPTTGGSFRASSYHPGGVNCMYMDGSVRFAPDNISIGIWRAISTCAGQDALADDEL